MIATDVRNRVFPGQSATTDECAPERSSSDPAAGAAQRRARGPFVTELPPAVALPVNEPEKEEEPGLILTDEQLFAIQVAVSQVTMQFQARSNISKVTHDSAMAAISNLK
jgi:hypothetical protein